MKGNAKLIAELNSLLAEELTAISQYMVHAEMCSNWGYGALHKHIQGRAVVEMKHAEALIERILFLEGLPVVSKLNKISIGADVPKMFQNDHAAEMDAVKHYNVAVKLAMEVGDNATKEILEHVLTDEDGHVDQIEERQDQIAQMGVENFLAQQIKE